MAMSFDPIMVGVSAKDPVFGLIAGGPGMGKTSLGALFPDPFFIKTEDGTSSLDALAVANKNFKRENVATFGKKVVKVVGGEEKEVNEDIIFDNTADVFGAIEWLRIGKHQRKTLVFDSLPRFEDIVCAEILDMEKNANAKNMNACHGGFSAGWDMARGYMAKLIKACKQLSKERNMHVLFLCHEAFETVERPDIQAFMRSNLMLYPGSKNKPNADIRALFIQECSLVAFIRQEVFVSSDRTKKQIEKGGNVGRVIENPVGRVISCHGEPTNVGKNRWGIQELLPYDLSCNPFEQYL